MLERLEERLAQFKSEFTVELATQIVGEFHKVADLLQNGPDAVTKKIAAQRLSISLSKLKGMIRSGEISTCQIGGTTMIPMREIRRLAEPSSAPPAQRRNGGRRRKDAKPNPRAESASARARLRAKR